MLPLTRPLITIFMESAISPATVRGLIIRPMVSAGYRASARIGPRIDRVNGCGYQPQVGHGCRASPGDGRHITTDDGHTSRDLAGPGYQASVLQAAAMVIEITTGVRRWFHSSTAPLRAATTLDGTRSRLGSAGADLTTGEEMTVPTCPINLPERVGADRTTVDPGFTLLHNIEV